MHAIGAVRALPEGAAGAVSSRMESRVRDRLRGNVAGERRDRAPPLRIGLFDRDPDELLQLATPDIEYVNPPYAVEPGVRRGLVAVAQAMRRFAEVWETSRHELWELYDCGDAVVAAVNWHIRGRGSERELVNKEAHTWTLREGRIARFEWGQDLGTALQAAGSPR